MTSSASDLDKVCTALRDRATSGAPMPASSYHRLGVLELARSAAQAAAGDATGFEATAQNAIGWLCMALADSEYMKRWIADRCRVYAVPGAESPLQVGNGVVRWFGDFVDRLSAATACDAVRAVAIRLRPRLTAELRAARLAAALGGIPCGRHRPRVAAGPIVVDRLGLASEFEAWRRSIEAVGIDEDPWRDDYDERGWRLVEGRASPAVSRELTRLFSPSLAIPTGLASLGQIDQALHELRSSPPDAKAAFEHARLEATLLRDLAIRATAAVPFRADVCRAAWREAADRVRPLGEKEVGGFRKSMFAVVNARIAGLQGESEVVTALLEAVVEIVRHVEVDAQLAFGLAERVRHRVAEGRDRLADALADARRARSLHPQSDVLGRSLLETFAPLAHDRDVRRELIEILGGWSARATASAQDDALQVARELRLFAEAQQEAGRVRTAENDYPIALRELTDARKMEDVHARRAATARLEAACEVANRAVAWRELGKSQAHLGVALFRHGSRLLTAGSRVEAREAFAAADAQFQAALARDPDNLSLVRSRQEIARQLDATSRGA